YDCQSLEYMEGIPKPLELYAGYFDIDKQELSVRQAATFLKTVADQQNSFNNLSLIHAYVMYRKMQLIHPEYYFILKDFGRTGKGLFMKTFDTIFQVNKVNFDNLKSSGIEASNEWFNLYGCDVAYANETGEIDKKDMRILRKIATCETVSGRTIGNNSIKFTIESVLILDTNETVDVGFMKANTSRTIKSAFKDRPKDETETQRHAFFQSYWEFIQPNGQPSLSASISFLIHSLNYLKSKGGKFLFDDVTLKNYYTADDLTETQRILALTIHEEGFILASDEELKKAVQEDYGSFRKNKAKQDVKKIGVLLNKPKWLDGQVFKVHTVGDKNLVEQVSTLINNEVNKSYE
ncbi:MAG: phage resistance protein, partial [Vagococcus sp.]